MKLPPLPCAVLLVNCNPSITFLSVRVRISIHMTSGQIFHNSLSLPLSLSLLQLINPKNARQVERITQVMSGHAHCKQAAGVRISLVYCSSWPRRAAAGASAGVPINWAPQIPTWLWMAMVYHDIS